jgi:hypothetical protein
MSKKFNGAYDINDGYAGKSRPQSFSVSADEIEDDMTEDAIRGLYASLAEADFQKRITVSVSREEAFVSWALEQIEARQEQA